MPPDDLDLGRLAQIGLLQDEDDVLQPFLLHQIEQRPGGLRPRISHRENEQHEIGAGDETLGDRLMLRHHRVGAGSIDDVEVPQKGDRLIALGQLRRDFDGSLLRAVAEDVNAIGRGQDVHLGKLLSEKRVQEGRLSRLHFADDDEEQRLPNVLEQAVQECRDGPGRGAFRG